jgi:hypothetical protein
MIRSSSNVLKEVVTEIIGTQNVKFFSDSLLLRSCDVFTLMSLYYCDRQFFLQNVNIYF